MILRTPALAALAALATACSSAGDGDDPAPTPIITSFAAADDSLTTGAAATLTAVFSGGTASVDHGVGTVTSGAAALSGALLGDTTFTLTVTNADGVSATATETVAVFPAATVASFSAAKSPVTAGDGTTLTAVFAGGVGSVDHGVGGVVSGAAAATGPLVADTTFTLTVTNPAGDAVTEQVGVAVVPAPVITSFGPAADPVLQGTGTELVAVFSGGTGEVTPAIGSVTSGVPVATGDLDATATWTLTVTNSAGDSATADATVTVLPPPSITSFTADTPFVLKGTPARLTAVFANGTGVVDGGVGAVASGVAAATPDLDAPATFTLTVTGVGGAVVTAQVTVGVTDCTNGAKDGDEEGIDCGGACAACPLDCAAVLAADAGAASGTYEIDPDGPGGSAAISAYCDMTSDGGGYTLCASFASGAKGDGLGYLTATWGTGPTPFFDGATIGAAGNFCGALEMSRIFGALWTSTSAERFRTQPLPTGGENPFAAPLGRHGYGVGGHAIVVVSKAANDPDVATGPSCAGGGNGVPQGSALCLGDGTMWNLLVGNLNDYQYTGEYEWMCHPDAFCGLDPSPSRILIFAR